MNSMAICGFDQGDLPKKRFERTCLQEYRVDIVEIREIRIDLHDPVRPAEYDGDNVEH